MRRLTARQAAERQAKCAYPHGTAKLLATVAVWFGLTAFVVQWGNSLAGGLMWVALYYGVANWILGGSPFEEANQFEWLSSYISNNLQGWTEVFWLGPARDGRVIIRSGRRYRFKRGYTVIELPLGGWCSQPAVTTADRQPSRWRVEMPPDSRADFSGEAEPRLPQIWLVDTLVPAIRYRLPIDRALVYLHDQTICPSEEQRICA